MLTCWPGLSKYGWEAHDGKTYGRQELHDTPFHLTTSWVKRQCTSCGYGGDWALLLDVKKAPTPIPTPDASAEHDPSDQDVKLPRISVFFYVADEAGRSAEIQTDGLKGRSGLQGGSRVVQGGGVAGGWQLHMGSSSKQSMGVLLDCDTICGLGPFPLPPPLLLTPPLPFPPPRPHPP